MTIVLSRKGGGGGGTPSSDLVQVASGEGSIRIPGLAGSPDIPLGGVNDDEFDTAGLAGWTTLGTPTEHNADTTIKSHYYISVAAAAGVSWKGIYKAAPAMPFTVVAKLTDMAGNGQFNTAALMVGEATPGAFHTIGIRFAASDPRIEVDSWTGPTGAGALVTGSSNIQVAPLYFALVANSSDDVDFYVSFGGMLFSQFSLNVNPTYTVGSIGLLAEAESASFGTKAAFDWIRFYSPQTN